MAAVVGIRLRAAGSVHILQDRFTAAVFPTAETSLTTPVFAYTSGLPFTIEATDDGPIILTDPTTPTRVITLGISIRTPIRILMTRRPTRMRTGTIPALIDRTTADCSATCKL